MIRGYHAWTKREVSKRAQEDQVLTEQIEQIFQSQIVPATLWVGYA